MKISKCKLTGVEFYLSDKEVDYYKHRNIELLNISEIERIRQGLSLIPIPIFVDSDNGLASTAKSESEKINTTFFNINAELDNIEIDPQVFLSISKFREYFSLFVQSFGLSNYVRNFGDPLLYGSISVKDSYDCNFCYNIYSSYDCILCSESRNLFFSRFSNRCNDSYFLDNCNDCSYCLFCSNLEGASYCAFNSQLTEQEYQELLLSLQLNFPIRLEYEKERFANFLQNRPISVIRPRENGFSKGYPFLVGEKFEVNFFSQNINEGSSNFCCNNLKDSFNCSCIWGNIVDSYSNSLIYGKGRKITRSLSCFGELEDLDLCISCVDSSHLFSCVGLTNSSYCIFNRQVKKTDYATIVQKLRTLIREGGLSGRNFLIAEKIIPYNKSLAGIIMPLTRVQAELLGFSWDANYDDLGVKTDIREDESLCEISGQLYSVSQQEKEFLREHGISEPKRSPLQRFKDRVRSLEISNMKKTQCSVTGKSILSWDAHGREVVVSNSTLNK